MTLQEQLRALIERHCTTIRDNVDAIGHNLALASEFPERSAEALREAEELAHQIKGSSGSVGFCDVSAAATRLDDELKILCAAGEGDGGAELDRALALYEALTTTAAAISPEMSTLFYADLSALEKAG